MKFENNIHLYMYKYLQINHILMYFFLLLLTLNVLLQIDECTLGGTCTSGWYPLA